MDPDLLQLMDESESIIDLETRLIESDIKFSNHKKYIKWLDNEWDKISSERIKDIMGSAPTNGSFPTLTVELDGVEFLLHGIVHGLHPILAPGWHPRQGVRDYISQVAASFDSPLAREEYLYEEGMHQFAILNRLNELKDQTYTTKKPNSLLEDVVMNALFLPLGVVSIFYCQFLFAKNYVQAKIKSNPNSIKECNRYLSQMALCDERYQALAADLQFATEMPQPFNLEKKYLAEKKSISFLLCKSLTGEPYAATSGERSLWTARKLIQYAERKRVKKLHYIGGSGHTSEIAYFLRNPDFSFQRLENYRTG